jgi:hypothetical protein
MVSPPGRSSRVARPSRRSDAPSARDFRTGTRRLFADGSDRSGSRRAGFVPLGADSSQWAPRCAGRGRHPHDSPTPRATSIGPDRSMPRPSGGSSRRASARRVMRSTGWCTEVRVICPK